MLMGVLYELSKQPTEAFEQIDVHYRRLIERREGESLEELLFTDAMAMLTEDDYVDPLVTQGIAGVYAHLDGGSREIRGPLGLNLALSAAQAATLAGDREGRAAAEDEARKLLRDPAVQDCFRSFYGIDDGFLLSRSSLHRVGTTSLILRCPLRRNDGYEDTRDVALKCLLPRYHGVRAIRAATKAYRKTRDYPDAPEVIKVTELTIAMEFIEGETLEQHLETRAQESETRALAEEDLTFLRDLGVAICRTLGRLAATGHHHLDLSPTNIIVVNPEAQPMRLRLIDFGHNFVITERVGSSAAFRRAELYVAPELVEHPSLDTWRVDAYSLGVILLVAAAKRQLGKEEIAAELDRLWQGDLSWEGAPTLARVIEELIDSDPAQRLILMAQSGTKNPYDRLARLIVQETEVMSLYEERTGSSGFGLLRGLGLFKPYGNPQVLNLLEVGRKIKNPIDDTYRDFPSLARWAAVSITCWVLALASFITLTFADLGWEEVVPSVKQLAEAVSANFEVGAFWDNLPGRMVALTFALTAVTYYVNNFSMLSPKRVGRRIGFASEIAMRGTAIFLAVPTMYAMLYDPQAWPICAAIGTALVVLNNFLALCLAKRAYGIGSRFSTRNAAGDRFITEVFKEWWRLMGAYSFSLFVIGVLLVAGIAHDEKIFAAVTVAINVAKMYRLNCVELAPQVRGCLSRDILTLRRADRQPRPRPDGLGEYKWKAVDRIYGWWWTPVTESKSEPTPPDLVKGVSELG